MSEFICAFCREFFKHDDFKSICFDCSNEYRNVQLNERKNNPNEKEINDA
jgi:hypothetical protein